MITQYEFSLIHRFLMQNSMISHYFGIFEAMYHWEENDSPVLDIKWNVKFISIFIAILAILCLLSFLFVGLSVSPKYECKYFAVRFSWFPAHAHVWNWNGWIESFPRKWYWNDICFELHVKIINLNYLQSCSQLMLFAIGNLKMGYCLIMCLFQFQIK